MSLEAKLDRIIELLESIDSKLQPKAETIVPAAVVAKPTKSQLEFKRMIEFAAGMDRTFLFSHIRKNAAHYMNERKQNPNLRFVFKPQFTPRLDEKIQKTGAQFYKDLKTWSDNYARGVEAEAEEVLQRAIGRLTARA